MKYQGVAVLALMGSCALLSSTLRGQMRDQNAPPQQMTMRGMSPEELQM